MTLFQLLQTLNIPCAYSHFKNAQTPPYIVYIGNGQTTFKADDTYYYKYNNYQVEYYFKTKSMTTEESIETLLLSNGYRYEKSEDIYLDDQDVFLIYYYV